MDWNTFRSDHKKRYGSTTAKQISKDWKEYKKASLSRSSSKNTKSKKSSANNRPKEIDLKKVLESLPKTRKSQISQLKTVMKHEGENRGSPTRGWGATAPQRGNERHQLKAKCGNSAFLAPDVEGFPIMKALRVTGGKCELSCQGVQAAKNRALQYHHYDVADKAQKVGAKNCGWSTTKK